MTGGKDPDCRKAFPWDETNWNQELRQWVKTLAALRKAHPALRRGDYQQLCMAPVEGCLGFARIFDTDVIVVVINASPETRTISIPLNSIRFEDGFHFKSLLHLQDYTVNQQILEVTLPPWSGDLIQADQT
jgi:glycosidase